MQQNLIHTHMVNHISFWIDFGPDFMIAELANCSKKYVGNLFLENIVILDSYLLSYLALLAY